MKKLNFLFLLLASIFTSQLYWGQGFTVASCSDTGSNTYGPMNSTTTANSKNRTAFIIPASQLSTIGGGTITSTFFKRTTATGTLTADATFKIYLKNTTATDFTSSALNWATEIGSASLVYDSNPQTAVGSTVGWKEFLHANNFVYTAGSNLAVYVEYIQVTAQAASISWSYDFTAPCVNTSNSNTTKYQNTSTAFTATLASTDYRRPHIGFNVTLPPATVAPGCSTVTAPVNAATAVSITPTVTWGAATNAQAYTLNIGTTPGGTNILNAYNAGLSTSYTIPSTAALNYNTTYYVKVIPTNNIGSATGCVESTFTTLLVPCPSVSSPANPAVGTSLKPTIIWTAVSGVTGYRLSVGTTSGGTDILNNVDLGDVLTYTFASNLNPSTQYFYTVTAYQGANTSATCTVRSFTTGSAVAPANDECANAIALTVNPNLTCTATTSGNTLGATMSLAATPCTGTPNDDVWYSFVATSASHTISITNTVSTGTSSSTDMYFQVLSGACGSLTSLICSDPDLNVVSGLTVGTTYYVRVYTYSSNANTFASFNICIGVTPPPPANDDCANAVSLTVNPDYSCGVTTAGSTVSATASTETAPTCGATGTNDDVWFKFIATSTAHRVTLTNVSGSTDMAMAAYSGACGSLVHVMCSDPDTMDLTGLTVGQEYKVRVWTYTSTVATNATFNICVGTVPPPPANDNCAGAIALTVNPDYLCGVTTSGNTLSATASTETAPTCGATGVNDDVWYKFTATNVAHRIALSNVSGSTDMAMSIYSGACGSLVHVMCSDPNTMDVTGLTVGQEYKIRVWTFTSTATTSATFSICVGTAPPPPVNDNCSSALSLTPGATFVQNAITGTTVSSTNIPALTASCLTTPTNVAGNVWYKVVVPASGNLTIETDAVTASVLTDTVVSVFADCTSTTAISCNDDDGNGAFSKLSLTGQTPGATLYISVWRYSTATDGTFQISAYDASLSTSEVSQAKNKLTAYPNPFADVLNISDVKNVKSISIVDIAGRLVKTIDKPSSALQLGDLNSGMYMVILNMNDGSKQTIKAIKK